MTVQNYAATTATRRNDTADSKQSSTYVNSFVKRNGLTSDVNKNTTEHQCDAISYNGMPIFLKEAKFEKGMLKR